MPNEEGRGFARRVTLATLEQFAALLRSGQEPSAADEASRNDEPGGSGGDSGENQALKDAEAQFGGVRLSVPLRYGRPSRKPTESRRPKTRAEPRRPEPAPGRLIWEKRLASSDAQQTAEGTNPTGLLRLSRAGFRNENGDLIHVPTYFRAIAFGDMEWAVVDEESQEEETWVPLQVRIQGEDVGEHTVRVSHKPGREAGQGNVTTVLHWGTVSQDLRRTNLTGATLRLYAPTEQDGPFFLDINQESRR